MYKILCIIFTWPSFSIMWSSLAMMVKSIIQIKNHSTISVYVGLFLYASKQLVQWNISILNCSETMITLPTRITLPPRPLPWFYCTTTRYQNKEMIWLQQYIWRNKDSCTFLHWPLVRDHHSVEPYFSL